MSEEMEEITIELGDETRSFTGRQISEQILGTDADDTKRIAYYETDDGTFYKHVIHGANLEPSDQDHELEEVSSMEVP